MIRKTPLKRSGFTSKDPKKRLTIDQMKERGLLSAASSLKPKKKMRARAKKKPGQKTQIEIFLEIWDERPHISEISGIELCDPPDDKGDTAGMIAWISQFSHILPKGSYATMKKVKRNIVLKTRQEHHLWETDKKSLINLPEWKWVFLLEESLKAEANGLSQ